MTTYETIRVETRADRYIVRLDRPNAKNAINSTMRADLADAFRTIYRDPRPVMITGTGGVFAAGADIHELRVRELDETLDGDTGELFSMIRNVPAPTVALVDGYALGGGAELSYACDIRIATSRAQFGNPEPRLGIIAGAGGCRRLTTLVGESMAKYILLTTNRVSADEALRMGLVVKVVDPDQGEDEANKLIDGTVTLSARALRVTKAVVNADGESAALERLGQAALLSDPERTERLETFVNRRRTDA